jgi:hypothetical protein
MSMKHIVMAGAVMLAVSAVAFAEPAGGTISGKVTYEGTPAKMKPIDMSKEPSCAKMYTTPPVAETVGNWEQPCRRGCVYFGGSPG